MVSLLRHLSTIVHSQTHQHYALFRVNTPPTLHNIYTFLSRRFSRKTSCQLAFRAVFNTRKLNAKNGRKGTCNSVKFIEIGKKPSAVYYPIVFIVELLECLLLSRSFYTFRMFYKHLPFPREWLQETAISDWLNEHLTWSLIGGTKCIQRDAQVCNITIAVNFSLASNLGK